MVRPGLRLLPFPDIEQAQVPILLSPPERTGHEERHLAEMLASGWIAPAGPTVAAFEAATARATTFAHVAALASGTAALHIAARLAGVGLGSEVWTSALTYIATVAPAVQMGARPVFFDVDPGSWTLDPDLLADALEQAGRNGRLPGTVIAVDLYGQCADIQTLRTICDRWGVVLIADCAESLGAMAHGRHAGRGAHIAAFSFNGNKIVTCGGGGALAAEDGELIARARFLATQAREPVPHYQHETTGHSYVLPAPCAAIGLAQLPRLAARVAGRRAVFDAYRDGLGDIPGLCFMPEPDWSRSSRWLTAVLLPPGMREAVRRALAAEHIESRPVWKPMHLQPVFRHARRVGGAVAAGLFRDGLCLPSGPMPPEGQARVIAIIRRVLGAG